MPPLVCICLDMSSVQSIPYRQRAHAHSPRPCACPQNARAMYLCEISNLADRNSYQSLPSNHDRATKWSDGTHPLKPSPTHSVYPCFQPMETQERTCLEPAPTLRCYQRTTHYQPQWQVLRTCARQTEGATTRAGGLAHYKSSRGSTLALANRSLKQRYG